MAAIPIRRSPHPELEARIHAALEARREKANAETPRRRLRLSAIGGCERKLWALANGHPAEQAEGRLIVIFDMGNLVEDLVIRWLRMAGYTIRNEQKTVTMIPEVDGHIDGEIWLEHSRFDVEPAILEIKSANAEQFELCASLGYDRWRPAYGDTLQAYMGASGIHVAMAVVLNKNTSQLYAEKLRFDSARYEYLQAKAEAILLHETPLPRPEEATSQHCNFCKWCHLAEACWGPTWDVRFDP